MRRLPSLRISFATRLTWICALISFVPLGWCWHDFRDLFWFGDEWDQLDQIAHVGFWPWVTSCFGENFAPVLKASWGALALGSHGQYVAVIAAVWCVHAACVVLFGRWLLSAGFGAAATAFVLLVFGLTATNIETLGWTIQLLTIEGMMFFLAAAAWHHNREFGRGWSASSWGLFVLLLVLSTFSFVRGTLVGISLAVLTGCSGVTGTAAPTSPRSRIAVIAGCLVPAIISAAVIMIYAPGNQHHLAAAGWRRPAVFALSYFLLSPAYKFVTEAAWTTPLLIGYGAMKIAVLTLGWWKASPSQRRVLLPLLVFDLGNAALMGIGRYNEPLITATSSRYQYISLICTLPFLGVVLESALAGLQRVPWWRRLTIAGVLAAGAAVALRGWPGAMETWADYRGRNTRYVLFQDPHPPAEGAIPGISFLTTMRAKELVAQYHLH